MYLYRILAILSVTFTLATGCAGRDPARTFASPTPASNSGNCAGANAATPATGVRCYLANNYVYATLAQAQQGSSAAGSNPFGIIVSGDCVIHDVKGDAFSCVAVDGQGIEITGPIPGVANNDGFVYDGGILYLNSAGK